MLPARHAHRQPVHGARAAVAAGEALRSRSRDPSTSTSFVQALPARRAPCRSVGQAQAEASRLDDQRLGEPVLERRQIRPAAPRSGRRRWPPSARSPPCRCRARRRAGPASTSSATIRCAVFGLTFSSWLSVRTDGKRSPGPQLARHDGPRHRVDHLVDDGFAGAQGEGEGQHRLVYQSQLVQRRVLVTLVHQGCQAEQDSRGAGRLRSEGRLRSRRGTASAW